MKTVPGLTASLLLLASCGGGAQSPATDQPIPFTQMPGALRRAICDKIFSCCSPAERRQNPDLGPDAQSCQGALDGEAIFFLNDVQASVAEGRLVYHADRMAKCIADLNARSCDQVKMPPGDQPLTDLCAGVFEAKVPVGGGCSGYWDCIGGWCEGDDGYLKDRCAPRKPIGGDCDEGPECESGVCSDDRVCVARPPGSGNLCAIGTESVGQHGAQPPPDAGAAP